MKNIILLFLINIVYSQNNEITAEYFFTDSFHNIETKSILDCKNTSSTYVTYLNRKKSKLLNEDEMTINIKSKKINQYIIFNKSKDEIKTFDNIKNNIYQITEKKTKFNWNFKYPEIKKIKNYTCNKATVNFRGRHYIAWFTTEIPTSFAPWKFSGLPGLILELSDDTNTYKWSISKIKFNSIKKLKIPYEKYTTVTLREFINLKKQKLEKLRAKIRSVLPRGTTFTKPAVSRMGLEVTYEWEK